MNQGGVSCRFQGFLQTLALRDTGTDGSLDQAVMIRRPIGQANASPIGAAAIGSVSNILCRPSTGCEGRFTPGIALGEFDALNEALNGCEKHPVEHERGQAEI
jgi:hypothetical protein